MSWKPIYAVLIFASTLTTYLAGQGIQNSRAQRVKKAFLVGSLVVNLGILFLFKYYNFFNAFFFDVLEILGLRMQLPNFDLLLPVGISFYTFQAVGYTVDVYRGEIQHEYHFGRYALFVSFFPQLVAGPIERASKLLPQFRKTIQFDYHKAIHGLKLIIWGYFMKLVVADRLSIYVNAVYNNSEYHGSLSLIVASIFFAFQIYCDFGGYSNIAIGCAKIMGFDLMTNFRRPYFARSTADFWRRWHISLSTWFKDYVYIPLGGNKVGAARNYVNLSLTFLISGLWHGANWTFVIWGGLNGAYQIGNKFLGIKSLFTGNLTLQRLKILIKMGITFVLICFSWIFFRANSLLDAMGIIKRIFSFEGEFFVGEGSSFVYSVLAICILLFKDFVDERNISTRISRSKAYKYALYALMVIVILSIGVFDGGQFIYFQF